MTTKHFDNNANGCSAYDLDTTNAYGDSDAKALKTTVIASGIATTMFCAILTGTIFLGSPHARTVASADERPAAIEQVVEASEADTIETVAKDGVETAINADGTLATINAHTAA